MKHEKPTEREDLRKRFEIYEAPTSVLEDMFDDDDTDDIVGEAGNAGQEGGHGGADAEDDSPEMRGGDEGGFWADPDGDSADEEPEDGLLEAAYPSTPGDGAITCQTPDVIVEESAAGFNVALAGNRLLGSPMPRAGREDARLLRDRQYDVLRLARIIVWAQQDYFRKVFGGEGPDAAWLALKPLTKLSAAKKMGVDENTVRRLAEATFLRPDMPGAPMVRLDHFFIRADLVKIHVGRLLTAHPAYSTTELTDALHREGVIRIPRGNEHSVRTYVRQLVRELGIRAPVAKRARAPLATSTPASRKRRS